MSKRIFLTGANGGIGQAISRRLAADGHQLLLTGTQEPKLKQLADSLPGSHHYFAGDLLLSADRERLLASVGTQPLDVVINNAGVNDFGCFQDQSPEVVQQMIALNVGATILLTQALLPHLSRHGQLLFIGSTFGSLGFPYYAVYSATKFAIRGFSEALRRELTDTGVQISYLAPRGTRTALNPPQVEGMNQALGSQMDEPDAVAEAVNKLISHPRRQYILGLPERLFVFLNQHFPALIDAGLKRQLGTIKQFARQSDRNRQE